jgi:prepilin peptidase CpaA
MSWAVPWVASITLGVAASVWDVWRRRVPNALTLGFAVGGVAYAVVSGGPRAAAWSLAGWGAGCALLLPAYLLRGVGAGDVKLLAAFGAWLGAGTVLWGALYGAIAGAVLAVAVSAAGGTLAGALRNVGSILWYWRTAGIRPVPGYTLADAKGPRLPYAVPIVLGVLTAAWLR